MSDTERPLLRVHGLTKIYPGTRGRDEVRAVDDVSFTIASGETLGLVGESGSRTRAQWSRTIGQVPIEVPLSSGHRRHPHQGRYC